MNALENIWTYAENNMSKSIIFWAIITKIELAIHNNLLNNLILFSSLHPALEVQQHKKKRF